MSFVAKIKMAIRCFAGDNVNFWLQTFKKPQTFRKLKTNFRLSKNKTNLGNLISLVKQQQESENFIRTIFQSKENRDFCHQRSGLNKNTMLWQVSVIDLLVVLYFRNSTNASIQFVNMQKQCRKRKASNKVRSYF